MITDLGETFSVQKYSIYFFSVISNDMISIWYTYTQGIHNFFSWKKVSLYRVTKVIKIGSWKLNAVNFLLQWSPKLKMFIRVLSHYGLKYIILVMQDKRKFYRRIEMKQFLRLLTTNTKWDIWADWDKPPEIRPPSGTWVATPNPPSLTGAEFSLLASNTQWGLRSLWMISLVWQYLNASKICLR